MNIFRKSVEKSQVSFKSDNNNGYFHEDEHHLWSYLPQFFLAREIFQMKGVEKKVVNLTVPEGPAGGGVEV
jgi:hypothetical protein